MSFKIIPLLRGFSEIERLYGEITARKSIICGGYARYCASPAENPERPGDVDVFPLEAAAYEEVRAFLLVEGFEVRHENEISLTFKKHKDPKWVACPTIQLIKPVVEGKVVTLGDMEKILENFDFTVVRAGIVSPKEVLVDEDFERDEKKRTLVFKNIHCPISSTFRVIKYTQRGYWIRPFEVLKLFLDWESRGIDYRQEIIELFKKAESFDSTKPEGEQGGLTKEEIQDLEKLMRID